MQGALIMKKSIEVAHEAHSRLEDSHEYPAGFDPALLLDKEGRFDNMDLPCLPT
jgi:hypothetical protein